MPTTWDVFLSYARSDSTAAVRIADSLRARGLRVFRDETGVTAFHGISDTILTELGRSRVLLAYYSATYPHRRACQHELTAAYLAGHREGDPRQRVLVINPEPTADHIHPVELRDARHASADPLGLPAVVDAVTRHVTTVPSPLGEIEPLTPPLWLPAPARPAATSFVGRLPLLWRLHSTLHPAPLTTGRASQVTVLHGTAGTGKTTLVTEYAHRFAAAFPGGIFWLTANGDDPPGSLLAQQRAIARSLTGATTTPPRPADLLATVLADRALPCLWVIDDLPPGLSPAAIRPFLGPHPIARTVLVSRSPHYTTLGASLLVADLPPNLAPPPVGPPHPPARSRRAAWHLQVELAHSAATLATPHATLRSKVTALHAIFAPTRLSLRKAGPHHLLRDIYNRLIHHQLRPLLNHWHPALRTWETTRPPTTDPRQHESAWPLAADLRAELAALHPSLQAALTDLSTLTGSRHGLPNEDRDLPPAVR